jgi:hypothetical protein
MFRHFSACVVGLLGVSAAACGVSSGQGPASDSSTQPQLADADGDGISDLEEGASELRDSDRDGVPDYLDPDSDGDGIPDSIEAGDDDLETRPVDSDGDGVFDYLDDDSDNNGRPDRVDGSADTDGDGIGDYADLDDDGDTLLDTFELGANPRTPPDTDGDGVPDFRDRDSDGDTIEDRHELANDPDRDGIPAYLDSDSDGDCIPDRHEAGDTDPLTPPVDSDRDGRPDFLDLDSDNDGIADRREDRNCNGVLDANETSATEQDSDQDGVTDLVEKVAGTDPRNPADNPRARGDFYFLMPYQKPAVPPVDTLEFRTSIQYADLYFSFDTTASMDTELAVMGNSSHGVPAIISRLQCRATGGTCSRHSDCQVGICFAGSCIEDPLAGSGCVPDLHTGVGVFTELNTFRNLVSVQADAAVTARQIPGIGGGAAEAPAQAAACVANGSLCENRDVNCSGAGVGCVGFRDDAVRILIQITDADDQCQSRRGECARFTPQLAGAELAARQIKFIGLCGTSDGGNASEHSPADFARLIGVASGSVDRGGVPFVYAAEDAQVVDSTVRAVLDIVRGVAVDVPIGAEDMPGDAGDALQFLDYLEVNVSGAGACTSVAPTDDRDGDGRDDAFPTLLPGTPVCWDVHPIAVNTVQAPSAEPAVFHARLTVYGDGSPLDSRNVYFLVPPEIVEQPVD